MKPASVCVVIVGVDPQGTPFSLFEAVTMLFPRGTMLPRVTFTKEPFYYKIPLTAASPGAVEEVTFNCKFMGHYGEPDLSFAHVIGDGKVSSKMTVSTLQLTFDPTAGTWDVEVCCTLRA